MFRFHPVFWLLIALFFLLGSRRRRRWSRRWELVGPMGYAPFGWGPRGADWERAPQVPAAPQPLAQPDKTLVESLESRIAELEQRLEFAEKLMANRKEQ